MTRQRHHAARRRRTTCPSAASAQSGMGHYHGREGFDDLLQAARPCSVQSRVNAISLFRPPYGRLFDALVRFLLR
ncbi:MAG: hypothetical protein MZW92_16310 [Comamonadaceae bacterium]|nr:hypothetical protein [Comamonadaceae bacterium]